jgi:hypothetical protein
LRTDKQCNICHEDFNDDWECSTLCVHDECLKNIREELEAEKEKFRIAAVHAAEYKAWVEKAEAENAQVYKTLGRMCELSDTVCSWVKRQNDAYPPDAVRDAITEIVQYVEQVSP